MKKGALCVFGDPWWGTTVQQNTHNALYDTTNTDSEYLDEDKIKTNYLCLLVQCRYE